MLTLISSIPTTVREGFDVQDLPARASTLSEEQMKKMFGGECKPRGAQCWYSRECCSRRCVGISPWRICQART